VPGPRAADELGRKRTRVRRTAADPHVQPPHRLALVTAAEARAVLQGFTALGTEQIAVAEAAGRVLARDVRAALDLPHFTRSYMDGYAVNASDTALASPARPVQLHVVGTVEMGHPAPCRIRRGETLRIPTGGMLPPGADAVVMVEHTCELDDGTVEIRHAATVGEHVMRRGDDVRRGEVVFRRGRRLRPADVGALAGIGTSRVSVHRRPRAALIATGDEIVPPEVTPGPGQVRNVNQYALRALIAAEGALPLDLGVLPDRRPVIARALARALRDADAVFVSGGTSVGTRDLAPGVIAALPRARILVHGIRIKPGKPTLVARVAGKPIVGLPGNPTSALVIFELFGVPLLRLLGGEPPGRALVPRRHVPARLAAPVTSQAGREDWIRVAVEDEADGDLVARPLRGGSGEIVSFAHADGLVCVGPESAGLEAGARVSVRLLG